MFGLFCFVLAVLVSPFKSKSRFEAENVAVCTENLICIDVVRESPKLTRWLRFSALCLRSWLGCITNTSGYDFRKGQVWCDSRAHQTDRSEGTSKAAPPWLGAQTRESCGDLTIVPNLIPGLPIVRANCFPEVWRFAKKRQQPLLNQPPPFSGSRPCVYRKPYPH